MSDAAAEPGAGSEAMPRPDPKLILRTGPGLRTDVDIRHHHMVVDEPARIGGTDQGPAPTELLIAALGTCMSITMRMYADRKDWPLGDVVIRMWHRVERHQAADPESRPERVDVFESEIELAGDLTVEQRQRLVEIGGRCPVKRSLEGRAQIRSSLIS